MASEMTIRVSSLMKAMCKGLSIFEEKHSDLLSGQFSFGFDVNGNYNNGIHVYLTLADSIANKRLMDIILNVRERDDVLYFKEVLEMFERVISVRIDPFRTDSSASDDGSSYNNLLDKN